MKIYLPATMATAVRDAAVTRGVPESQPINELLSRLGEDRLTALANEERYADDDKRLFKLVMPEDLYAMVCRVVVAADCSISHVVQRALLTDQPSVAS